jgi:hypothetical protein
MAVVIACAVDVAPAVAASYGQDEKSKWKVFSHGVVFIKAALCWCERGD